MSGWGADDVPDSGGWDGDTKNDGGNDEWNETPLESKSGNAGGQGPIPITSAVATENVPRAQRSKWVDKKSVKEGASQPEEVDVAKTNEVNKTDVPAPESTMNAREAMLAGNGSAFESDKPEFASLSRKYEWKDEYGDVGPEVPELEAELYKDKFLNKIGEQFAAMTVGNVAVTVESEESIDPVFHWKDAGLHPVMLQNIKLCDYSTPTAIQSYCIPAVLTGHDVIAISHTGSGKTAAYFVPALSKLMGKVKKLGAGRPQKRGDPMYDPYRDGIRAEPLILVLVPTRELACQIFDEARRLCYRSMLRPCVVYGGGPIRDQVADIRSACDILIATPGRLIDFMGRSDLISLHRLKYTIIDEADELVQPDWLEQMDTILSGPDTNHDADHRYMMFSATFPRAARALAKRYLAEDHIRIRIGRVGAAHKHVSQAVVWVDSAQKNQACLDLLLDIPPARTLIFVNSKHTCDQVDDFLYNSGMPSTSIHSGRTQIERESALRGFRSGKTPIMVATGVSARGLDVFNVMHVINYDLPSGEYGGIHEYVHRIGRTARIGNIGSATSFYNDRDEVIAQDLVNILLESGQPIPDFLEGYKPAEGDTPVFADDKSESGDEDNMGVPLPKSGSADDDDGWGGDGVAVVASDQGGW